MIIETITQTLAAHKNLPMLTTLITGGILLASCSADTEGTDSFEEKHAAELENMALSAGTSTIFLDSSKSFDTDAEWLSGS